VITMKHLVGLLYLATALIGFYWSIYLTLTGLYGVPFSRWYVVIFIGAVVLFAGAVLWWASTIPWTRVFPIVGRRVANPTVRGTGFCFKAIETRGGAESFLRFVQKSFGF
jgi:hypothetical protein